MPLAQARQLEAPPPRSATRPSSMREARLDRERAEEGFLAPADDPDLDAVSPAERAEEPLAVRGVADGGGGDGDHPRARLRRARVRKRWTAATVRSIDSSGSVPRRRPEPCLHPLLLEHLEAQPGTEARQQQTDRIGAELEEGDDIAGHGLGCYPAGPAGTTARAPAAPGLSTRRPRHAAAGSPSPRPELRPRVRRAKIGFHYVCVTDSSNDLIPDTETWSPVIPRKHAPRHRSPRGLHPLPAPGPGSPRRRGLLSVPAGPRNPGRRLGVSSGHETVAIRPADFLSSRSRSVTRASDRVSIRVRWPSRSRGPAGRLDTDRRADAPRSGRLLPGESSRIYPSVIRAQPRGARLSTRMRTRVARRDDGAAPGRRSRAAARRRVSWSPRTSETSPS